MSMTLRVFFLTRVALYLSFFLGLSFALLGYLLFDV